MWFLVGATSCHVVFNGGHILECQSCGSSAVPARVARQALFASTRTPVPARVARRPRQGRSPAPLGSGRSPIGSTVPACLLECVVGRLRRSSAGPARVVRRPRQGGLPSSFWECGFSWGPHVGMWILVGATFCHVVFSGGHILEMGPPRSATSLLQTTILVIKLNVAKSCFDSWLYQV